VEAVAKAWRLLNSGCCAGPICVPARLVLESNKRGYPYNASDHNRWAGNSSPATKYRADRGNTYFKWIPRSNNNRPAQGQQRMNSKMASQRKGAKVQETQGFPSFPLICLPLASSPLGAFCTPAACP
jgi:hypothetical protein